MQSQSLVSRVDRVECRVEILEQLPEQVARLESQFLQFRDEVRGEFSALRAEIEVGDEEMRTTLRAEVRAGDEETRRVLRDGIRAGDEETRRVLRDEIRVGDEETRRVLRDEIRVGDEETRHLMRVLHEDVIGRLSILQEQTSVRPPTSTKAAAKASSRRRKR